MTRPPGVEQGRAEPLIIWMGQPVASRLRALGYEQPVELELLPGHWWSIRADLAALGSSVEPGSGFGQTAASSEAIAGHFSRYWLDVVAGPFGRPEDREAVYLASREADIGWLGEQAIVVKIEPWLSRHLRELGHHEPVLLSSLADKYWVCGMGGGCCSTAELESLARQNPRSVRISHGPFDREEDAHYAFDVLWESPE